jgi:micrococcal nuclease
MARVFHSLLRTRSCTVLGGTVDAAWPIRTLCLIFAVVAMAGAPLAQAGAKPPPASPGTSHPSGPTEFPEAHLWGTVQMVLNATSLVVVTPDLMRYDVRLLGIDPPELPRAGGPGAHPIEGQPFGLEAANYLRDLALYKQVQFDTYGKDNTGRTLAVVWLGDLNLNLILVREGLAWVKPQVPVTKVRVELEVAERQAQVGKYGLWALPDPEPPWKFRQRSRLPAE